MADLAIDTMNLRKRFGVGYVVDRLNIQVARGQIYGFIGPNGAGKTTTMKMLATLLRPTSGTAQVLGCDLSDAAGIRSRIGYMPEMTALYEKLNVDEYLRLFAYAYMVKAKNRDGAVEGVIELLDLDGVRFRIINNLSKGVRQRIALARCLIHDPDLLLLDEPSSGLDPNGRLEMRELLKELRNMGKTVFVSSHVLAELQEICDGVGVLENGKLLFSGSIAELRSKVGVRQQFRIRLETGEMLDEVARCVGVREVERDEASVLFEIDDCVSQADVVAHLAGKGARILELIENERDLEDMFVALTKGSVT